MRRSRSRGKRIGSRFRSRRSRNRSSGKRIRSRIRSVRSRRRIRGRRSRRRIRERMSRSRTISRSDSDSWPPIESYHEDRVGREEDTGGLSGAHQLADYFLGEHRSDTVWGDSQQSDGVKIIIRGHIF